MRQIYEWLLWLYPAEFRRQFGAEMLLVFGDAREDAHRAGWVTRMQSALHESGGMVCGALGEHMRSVLGGDFSRRFAMFSRNSRFRFPIASITFMAFSLAGVIYAIHNARVIALSWADARFIRQVSLLQTFGFAFGATLICAVVGWAVLHTLHRSGVHRLSEAQTWPQQ